MSNVLVTVFCLTTVISSIYSISINDWENLFGTQDCIIGTYESVLNGEIQANTINQQTLLKLPKEIIFNDYKKHEEKSAMSRIHELAQHNKVEYVYKLIKEEGPPHNKVFTVTLNLGTEEYESNESSLKKAQQTAAIFALEETLYKHPPIKISKETQDSLTPTVILNNIATKLGIAIAYFLVDKSEQSLSSHTSYEERPVRSYLQKLNDSIYDDQNFLHVRQDESQLKGPFYVRVDVGDDHFVGFGHTIQAAKHNAALKAIETLKNTAHKKKIACLEDGQSNDCQKAKDSLKSPISRVYEEAQLRNMDVEFEVIEEMGPPHKRIFKMQGRVGHIIVEAEGNSKKKSKTLAAEKVLTRISELPAVSDEKQIVSGLKKKKDKKRKKNKIDKSGLLEESRFGGIGDVLSSVVKFGSEKDNQENNVDENGQIDESNTDKQKFVKKSSKSPQKQLLEIGNELNFELQFHDLDKKGDLFYSALSLGIKPSYICFGKGLSVDDSRNYAANAGLKVLFQTGLLNKLDTISKSTDKCPLEKENVEFILEEIPDDSILKDEL